MWRKGNPHEQFPGEGNGNPFQYSYLENPMDSGAWWAVVPAVTAGESKATEGMNTHWS